MEPVSRLDVRRSGRDESDRIWVVYGHLATWQQHNTVFEKRYELTSPYAALFDFVQRTRDVSWLAVVFDRVTFEGTEDVVVGFVVTRGVRHSCTSI